MAKIIERFISDDKFLVAYDRGTKFGVSGGKKKHTPYGKFRILLVVYGM